MLFESGGLREILSLRFIFLRRVSLMGEYITENRPDDKAPHRVREPTG
jgi:hypothetical protein